MIQTQDFTSPPSRLALRVVCGSVAAAAVVLLAQQGPWQENLLRLEAPDASLWLRCGASLLVLMLALLLAGCLGLGIAMAARGAGRRAERMARLAGSVAASVPVAALTWVFVGVWTGRLGLPVESLLPADLLRADHAWLTVLARRLWEVLAPALVLAVPLTGEVVEAAAADASATTDMQGTLRARGVPRGARLWRHHLRQMLPLLRARLQGLCLVAPAYLLLIEDALRFMGWGGWMAQAVREAAAPRIALGFLLGGGMIALLCLLARLLLPGQVRRHKPNRLSSLAWQPWLLWLPGLVVLSPLAGFPWLACWFAVLLTSSAAWHDAWTRVERELPLDAAKVLGAGECAAWLRHTAPVQARMLLAWLCASLGQTLWWAAAACCLHPPLLQELGGPLVPWLAPLVVDTAAETAHILQDPAAMAWAGGRIALAVLCFIQVSRIIRPRPFFSSSSLSS